jgi:hypothetical protein
MILYLQLSLEKHLISNGQMLRASIKPNQHSKKQLSFLSDSLNYSPEKENHGEVSSYTGPQAQVSPTSQKPVRLRQQLAVPFSQ